MTKFLSDPLQIERWLKKQDIREYALVEDKRYGYVVDVFTDVELSNRELKKIAVKFNIVNGGFFCQENCLTSLQGSPNVVNGDVYACNNKLTNLIGSPRKVYGDFYCHANYLTTLKGCPSIIEGDLNADCNNLNKSNFPLSNLPEQTFAIDLSGNTNLFDYQHITSLEELKAALEKDLLCKSISDTIITKPTYKI